MRTIKTKTMNNKESVKELYIVSSKQNKDVLSSKDYGKLYDFVVKNQDTKFYKMDFNVKPKLINRKVFLKNYYNSEKNLSKLFVMMQVLFKNDTHISTLVSEMKLNTEYKQFKASI